MCQLPAPAALLPASVTGADHSPAYTVQGSTTLSRGLQRPQASRGGMGRRTVHRLAVVVVVAGPRDDLGGCSQALVQSLSALWQHTSAQRSSPVYPGVPTLDLGRLSWRRCLE